MSSEKLERNDRSPNGDLEENATDGCSTNSDDTCSETEEEESLSEISEDESESSDDDYDYMTVFRPKDFKIMTGNLFPRAHNLAVVHPKPEAKYEDEVCHAFDYEVLIFSIC
jgi:hypothetical protein